MPYRPAAEKRPYRGDNRQRPTGSAHAPNMDRQTQSSETISWTRTELVCAGAVFLIAVILYSCTLAPTVTLTDSGELIVVAQALGVAHPPGFPLWVVLAHMASLVPFGNVAVRVNFSSA